MSVNVVEIADLRREVDAMLAAGAVNTLAALGSTAEVVAFLIYSMKADGADKAEVLDGVETLVVAADLSREEVRETRDLLVRLGYGSDLGRLLTRLSRKAKLTPPRRWANRAGGAGAPLATPA